ncbi:MAG: hypothetical protein K0R51_362 [Cytophagaceae bacterium]|jgi:hypothetical protein|nr:hypothetical protein [Cytophagaceae bacterium]
MVHVGAQARTVKLNVRNEINASIIAFPHVVVNDTLHIIGDAQGVISISCNTKKTILRVSNFQYHEKTVVIEPGNTDIELTVTLGIYKLYIPEEYSTELAVSIVKRTQYNAKKNDFLNTKNTSYKLYTRFTISSEEPDVFNSLLLGFLKVFGVKAPKLFSPEHHLYIMETNSDFYLKNRVYRKELYTSTKSSGLALPLVFAQTSHEFIPNPYSNFIKINKKEYTSPLADNALQKYSYAVVDSFTTAGVIFWTVKFTPKANSNFSAMYGLMTVSSANFSIKNFICYPAWDNKNFREYCLTYGEDRALQNYSIRISNVSPLQNDKKKFFIQSSTNLYPDPLYVKTKFNEYVVEINDTVLIAKADTLSGFTRPYPLTTADSLTYSYYDQVKYARFLQQLLNVGENFYYGFIPLGKVDLETNKIVNLNGVEGFRLGMGGATNENFSKKVALKGFVAFGIADKRLKYGLGTSYKISKPLEWKVGTEYSYQLTEAGGIEQYFSDAVFSSERLRKYQLRIMDYNSSLSLYSTIHPYQNVDLYVASEWQDIHTAYDYFYKGENMHHMQFNLLKVSARIAPFEKYIKLSERKIELGSKYPVLYASFTQNYDNGILKSGFTFYKWDIRIDQEIRLVQFGTTHLQFIAGATEGSAPYTALFNGKGSLKSPSVVIHNSFETMGYNEFLSDHYWAIFVSHNFGRLYYRSKLFKPSLLLLYNLGNGTLKNPERHQGEIIPFKTMDKNYSEAGLLLTDILSFKLSGLKVGVGGGVFTRLGEYQYQTFGKNIVWKFSVNFNI